MMNKNRLKIAILWLIFLVSLLSNSQVEAAEKSKSKLILVQHIAGVFIGPQASKDDDVKKKYGDGLYVLDEGHGGGRYFTDSKQSITLHTTIGVDNVIEEVELMKGVHLPPAIKDPKKSITQTLKTPPKIDKGLHLGMTESALLKQLGTPTRDKKQAGVRILEYEAMEEDDPRIALVYTATYTFSNGRLIKILLYDGE